STSSLLRCGNSARHSANFSTTNHSVASSNRACADSVAWWIPSAAMESTSTSALEHDRRNATMSATFTPVTDDIAAYIEELFSAEDDVLRSLREEAAARGMPPIHISGAQGAVLQVLLRAIGARHV